MYTTIDFPTKKKLKEAVAQHQLSGHPDHAVRVYQPNDMFGKTKEVQTGEHHITLEGPHYPKPHSWYAEAVVRDGVVVKVK